MNWYIIEKHLTTAKKKIKPINLEFYSKQKYPSELQGENKIYSDKHKQHIARLWVSTQPYQ